MQICCAGEVMVELAASGEPGIFRQGLAGDSYNTAIYMARAGLAVNYLTHLGDDDFSSAIYAQLQTEGVGIADIQRIAGRQPGLYLINNTPQGERSFSYWRDNSPAREMFDQPISISACQSFYFTGITLAVTRSGIDNFISLLQRLRQQQVVICFDPNYRPRLWANRLQAQQYYQKILPFCDTVLPTLDDDTALWGHTTALQCAAMYQGYGATEIVVKTPALLTHVFRQGQHLQRQAAAVTAIDTTGAGDSFSAAYLAARLTGAAIEPALAAAQQLAATVVQYRGAIVPRTNQPR